MANATVCLVGLLFAPAVPLAAQQGRVSGYFELWDLTVNGEVGVTRAKVEDLIETAAVAHIDNTMPDAIVRRPAGSTGATHLPDRNSAATCRIRTRFRLAAPRLAGATGDGPAAGGRFCGHARGVLRSARSASSAASPGDGRVGAGRAAPDDVDAARAGAARSGIVAAAEVRVAA